jgi:hypothetical protein
VDAKLLQRQLEVRHVGLQRRSSWNGTRVSAAGGQIWRRMQLIVLGKNSPVICSLLAHCYEL